MKFLMSMCVLFWGETGKKILLKMYEKLTWFGECKNGTFYVMDFLVLWLDNENDES